MSKSNGARTGRVGPVRCAVYTRKSTSEGLDADFNSLDAQREAAEHYVKSQAALGWTLVPTAYDDGGFTGGNLERPALQRLLQDVDAGLIDMVVVYKVDRLSRSLMDFARLVERLERKNVGFVSMTQHFDTSTSMGRLVLNVLLSFAQFEHDLIRERTRDKIQAARKRGKWTGGKVVLGYRVDPARRGLVIEPDEANLVRRIFAFYQETGSICEVANRLNRLGLCQKPRGKAMVGRSWDKSSVHRILRNPLYVGKVRAKDGSLHVGEHEAIVRSDVFDRVGQALDVRTTGRMRRSRQHEYLLTGLLRCGPCDAAMTSAAATGRSGRRYRYYRCRRQQNEGTSCPTGQLVAGEVEQVVVAHLKDVTLRADVRRRVMEQLDQAAPPVEIEAVRVRLSERLGELGSEAKRLLAAFRGGESGGRLLAGRLGEIEAEMDEVRKSIAEAEASIQERQGTAATAERMMTFLDSFDAVWEALLPVERREMLHLLIARIHVDPGAGLRIVFHELATASDRVAATA